MTVCPFAAWRPVGNHGGRMSAHLGLILHVQEGNGGLSGWFNNPASSASSTWWVAKNGVLEQYVDADACAWAQGAGNSTYNSVETEGYHTEPLTPAQEATLADLYEWGMATYLWLPQLAEADGQVGFGWHGMGGSAWGGHYDCPGDLRRPRRQPILDMITAGPPLPEEQEDDDNMIATDPATGGVWCAKRDGAVYTVDGAPYLGGTNNDTVNAGGFPCVGIDAWGDGYVLVLDFGESGPDDAGQRFRTYHFPRDGSGIV